MTRRIWLFLAITFSVSWTIWIVALKLGVGPGNGEYFLSFGSAAPAVTAILLSRSQTATIASTVTLRVLRFLWSCVLWLFALAVYLLNDQFRGINIHVPRANYVLVVAILALLPAWILAGALTRNAGVHDLLRTLVRPRNRGWLMVALLCFPAFLLIPAAAAHLLGKPLVWPQHRPLVSPVAAAVMLFLNSFFFTATFEEPGWRGFLLPRLQQKFSPALASVFVWFPWALWHAPLDVSGGLTHAWMNYLQLRVIFLLPMAVIFTWLYNRSAGNLLCVALFHASMNTFPFVLPYFPPALALLILFAIVVLFTDRMWRKLPNAASSG